MAELLITVGSHFFKCTCITPRARPVLEIFARQLIKYGWARSQGKYSRAALCVFATASNDRSEYRFHINQLKSFKELLAQNSIVDSMVTYVTLSLPKAIQVELPVKSNWIAREEQIPAIDYVVSDEPSTNKFVPAQTGFGKGLISIMGISKIGLRTLIVVKPMYLEKWVAEIEEKFDINMEDVVVIRGSNQLMALLQLASENNFSSKIILISSKTLTNWIRLYETYLYQSIPLGYKCVPEDLCAVLGVGVLLMDEVHQEFHSNYKFLLNTNVYKSISLSATLLSDDAFITKMYSVVYPPEERYVGAAYKRYIHATAVFYRFENPLRIKYKDYVSKTYSHHIFEQCILRSERLKTNYFGMIGDIFKGTYIKNYKPGQKCLIFCISIDMCTQLRNYLSDLYSNLDIRRYVGDDEYTNLMTADVSISTMQSSGTAVDIPNLSTVIMTTAMSSTTGNVQGFGRLRQLKDGTTPIFTYLVCEDIEKHIQYHEKKRDLLEVIALTYNSTHMTKPI